MMLLSIEQIVTGLAAEFGSSESPLSDFVLMNKGIPEGELDAYERELGFQLPADFRHFINDYDLGEFTLGSVTFGSSGSYLEDLRYFNADGQWWGFPGRPRHLLMFANSDPLAFVYDMHQGHVYAISAEEGWQSRQVVADGFVNFFRGLGTVMLLRLNHLDQASLGEAVNALVGGESPEFWRLV